METIDAEELAHLLRTQTAYQQAVQAVPVAKGAMEGHSKYLRIKYRLENGDRIDPHTGEIMRAGSDG